MGALRQALPAILLAGLLLTPFLDSADTIDDSFFLAQARQVLEHPLDPSGFEIAWIRQVDRASLLAPTGPGMAYILAPTLAAGGGEWLAHLTQLSFLALAALALAQLARRLSASEAEARLAALMLVATPAVLGMAGTAMPDVPAMALGLLGLERAAAFGAGGGAGRGLATGVCLGAAILVRSHAAMLLPVAALLLGGLQKRGGATCPGGGPATRSTDSTYGRSRPPDRSDRLMRSLDWSGGPYALPGRSWCRDPGCDGVVGL